MSADAAAGASLQDGHDEEEHEEHANHEAWVIPYADILTLLMALFLVLWAISTIDLQKFEQMAAGFSDALGGSSSARMVETFSSSGGPDPIPLDGAPAPGDGDAASDESLVAPDVVPSVGPDLPTRDERAEQALRREETAAIAAQREQAALDAVRERIATAAAREGLAAAVGFRQDPRGLVVTVVADRVLFEPGSARIRPEGWRVISVVAGAVAGLDNAIAVEGHTDSRPITTAAYPSNWELSTARATTVLRTLVERHGFPRGRIAASGYADTQPVADNADAAGRARNRRVELVILTRAAADASALPSG